MNERQTLGSHSTYLQFNILASAPPTEEVSIVAIFKLVFGKCPARISVSSKSSCESQKITFK